MSVAIGMVVLAHAGTKVRPCVVLRVRDDGAMVVIAGTGTARECARVAVEQGTRAWIAMRLEKSTYFYPSNLCVLTLDKLTPTDGMCPPATMMELRLLVGIR